MAKAILYSEEFLKYGFIKYDKDKQEARPQCVNCNEVLANESMKPSELKRHLESKHVELVGKSVAFFKEKKNN